MIKKFIPGNPGGPTPVRVVKPTNDNRPCCGRLEDNLCSRPCAMKERMTKHEEP